MDRVHIFLNGSRGLPVLSALVEAGHRVAQVIAPVSKDSGGAIESAARSLGLEVNFASDVNAPAFIEEYRARRPQVAVVAGFSTIFSKPLIAVPERGTLNLHGGRLPAYRGGSPLNWQIINREPEVGISVIQMDEGIDTGLVLSETRFPLDPEDTIADVHKQANALFPQLTLQALERLGRGECGKSQDEAAACYWHQRNDGDGRIRWRDTDADDVLALVRGVTHPYSGAWTRCGNDVVRIFRAARFESLLKGVPGRVIYLQGKGPIVTCRDRAVLLTEYTVTGAAGRLHAGRHLE